MAKKKPAKAKSPKPSKTLAWYKKELDKWFSVYIRLRDKGLCFTCGDKKYWKYQQNGHYVSRAILSLRFDEKNCNCQCVGCNVFRNGNMDEYAIRLQKKHGKGILQELHKQKYQVVKINQQWYETKIIHYKKLAKKLMY